MNKYNSKIPWNKQDDFLKASEEELELWKTEAIEIDNENHEICLKRKKDLLQIQDLSEKLWGKKSNQYRYVRKQWNDNIFHYSKRLYAFDRNVCWRDEKLEKVKKEEEQKNKEREKSNKEKELIRECLKIAIRHELDESLNYEDLFYSLCDKDKYFDLAINMLRTRNDWNDGFYRVENAISRFKPETDVDRDIENDIMSRLEYSDDFESDGRIFRDMGWNYNKIFELVDGQVYKDGMYLFGIIEEEYYG